MPISFTCPSCGQASVVGDEFAGRTGPCRSCGQTVTIPMSNGMSNPMSKPAYAPPPSSGGGGGAFATVAVIVAVLGIGGVMCAGVLVALLLPAVQAARTAARRMQSQNNMKQIALAFHNYESSYKCLPAAYHVDADGKRTMSWRVAILPFLEQQQVFQMYKADEPWDSAVNQSVSNITIPTYKNPADPKGGPTETSYMVITGPGTLFEEGKQISLSEITDGTSNTILAVEVIGTGVKWAEPKDLDINTMVFKINGGGANSIGSPYPGGANVAMADGSVRFMSDSVLEATLRAMATRNGGEVIQVP
jgi:prepilin-type processing-associated H-X9-DG protein